jgi:alcohol dehydrogenase
MPISKFLCPTTIHFGSGVSQQLPAILSTLGAKRLFLVVDSALLSTPFYESVKGSLDNSLIDIVLFSEIEPDPSSNTVQKAFEHAQQHQADSVLAIGGGSAIDVAKAVAILMVHGGKIHEYEGSEKFDQPGLPLIAIPTTAGTGSEVSGSCVITDSETNRKMSIRHARLNPARFALLDPDALVTLPASVAAHAGLDAFVHALESFTSLKATPITDALNIKAIALISHDLRAFVKDRSNHQAALNMLLGSAMAGMSFGQTGLGNVHCMARFVGAKYHVSHGLSNALCLTAVADHNRVADPTKYAQIAQAMGVSSQQLNEQAMAQLAVQAIAALCRDVGIPDGLRHVGAKPEDFDTMAADCVSANYTQWNPRPTDHAAFVALFEAAY